MSERVAEETRETRSTRETGETDLLECMHRSVVEPASRRWVIVLAGRSRGCGRCGGRCRREGRVASVAGLSVKVHVAGGWRLDVGCWIGSTGGTGGAGQL